MFPRTNLGILCPTCLELLGFRGSIPATQMNKVLKEQSGLGGSREEREHFPGSPPDGSGGGRREV